MKDERLPADDSSFPEGPIPPLDASLASTALSTLLPQDASVFTTGFICTPHYNLVEVDFAEAS